MPKIVTIAKSYCNKTRKNALKVITNVKIIQIHAYQSDLTNPKGSHCHAEMDPKFDQPFSSSELFPLAAIVMARCLNRRFSVNYLSSNGDVCIVVSFNCMRPS